MISRTSIIGKHPVLPLGDVVEFLDHMRKPITESNRVAGPYPYYGANGQQGTMNSYIFDEPLVLLAEDGGLFDQPDRGVAYRISGKTWVNNHAHVLRPTSRIDVGYLCRVLENYDLRPFISGSTRGKLTKGSAVEIPIPIPPLLEQQRIAAFLDQVDVMRIKRRQALAKLDTLTQSLFLELFGEPVRNDKNWKRVHLLDASRNITDGTHDTPERVASGVPFITSKNIRPFEFDLSSLDFVTMETHREIIKRCNAQKGDVLYTNIGVNVGNAVANFLDFDFSLKNVALIQPDFEKLDTRFLEALLNYKRFKEEVLRTSSVGGAQKFVSLTTLRGFEIILPPISLQRRFAVQVEEAHRVKKFQRESLAKLDALFASLQHRAFKGEL